MKLRLSTFLILILFPYCAFCQSGKAKTDPHDFSAPTATITSNSALPLQTSGPQRIVIQYINPLHFQYSLQVASTPIAAPTPPAAIALSASTSGGGFSIAAFPKCASPTILSPDQSTLAASQWKAISENISNFRQYVVCTKQKTDRLVIAVSTEAQCYKDRLSFYSSFVLDDNSANLLRLFVTNNEMPPGSKEDPRSPTVSCRNNDADTLWPFEDLQQAEQIADRIQSQLFNLADASDFNTWESTHKDIYASASSLLSTLLSEVQGLEEMSDAAKNYQTAYAYNDFWRTRIHAIAQAEQNIEKAKAALNAARQQSQNNSSNSSSRPRLESLVAALAAASQRDPLIFAISETCSANWYGRGRTDTFTLHYADITAIAPSDQSSEIDVNSCLTLGTVSTGIGISFLRNQVFGFVAGRDPNNPDNSTNIISTIGTTTDQQISPLYAIQYNFALKDFDKGWGLHAAVGAALGSSSGTANIELIAGPAISFHRRAFFITPAFQLARRDELLPGFNIGDSQGTLTAVPTHTSWKPGFALTFTFSVAQ